MNTLNNHPKIINWNCPFCGYPAKGWLRNPTALIICPNCDNMYITSKGKPHKIKQEIYTKGLLKEYRRQGFNTGCDEIARYIYKKYKKEIGRKETK